MTYQEIVDTLREYNITPEDFFQEDYTEDQDKAFFKTGPIVYCGLFEEDDRASVVYKFQRHPVYVQVSVGDYHTNFPNWEDADFEEVEPYPTTLYRPKL